MAAAEADGDAPIAAFAVSKDGVVLKHNFLNAPPAPEAADRGGAVGAEEEDPPVTVGRHPDCHVLVDHPSVSRFHLQLRARRHQRRITVTDLRSGETHRHPPLCTSPSSSSACACRARNRHAWAWAGGIQFFCTSARCFSICANQIRVRSTVAYAIWGYFTWAISECD